MQIAASNLKLVQAWMLAMLLLLIAERVSE